MPPSRRSRVAPARDTIVRKPLRTRDAVRVQQGHQFLPRARVHPQPHPPDHHGETSLRQGDGGARDGRNRVRGGDGERIPADHGGRDRADPACSLRNSGAIGRPGRPQAAVGDVLQGAGRGVRPPADRRRQAGGVSRVRPRTRRGKSWARGRRSISAPSRTLPRRRSRKGIRSATLQLVNRRLDRKVQELNTLFDLGKEFGRHARSRQARAPARVLAPRPGGGAALPGVPPRGSDMIVVASRIDGPPPQSELLARAVETEDRRARRGPGRPARPRPAAAWRPTASRVVVPMQLQGRTAG